MAGRLLRLFSEEVLKIRLGFISTCWDTWIADGKPWIAKGPSGCVASIVEFARKLSLLDRSRAAVPRRV